jgi:hypothetical protein
MHRVKCFDVRVAHVYSEVVYKHTKRSVFGRRMWKSVVRVQTCTKVSSGTSCFGSGIVGHASLFSLSTALCKWCLRAFA